MSAYDLLAAGQVFIAGQPVPLARDHILWFRPGAPLTAAITATPGAPGVIIAPIGYRQGDILHFTTTGVLPSGLFPGTNYFVTGVSSPNTFQLSLTLDGPSLPLTDAGTGTHTAAYQGRPFVCVAPVMDPTGATMILRCEAQQ